MDAGQRVNLASLTNAGPHDDVHADVGSHASMFTNFLHVEAPAELVLNARDLSLSVLSSPQRRRPASRDPLRPRDSQS